VRKSLLARSNTRGVADTLTIAIVLFVIEFLGIITYKIVSGMNTVIQASDVNNNESKAAYSNFTSNYANSFDQGMILALSFAYIITLIFAYRVNTDPGYFFISLFVLIILIGITAVFGQIYELGTNNPDFVNERAAMPYLNYILTHTFVLSIVAGILLFIVLFSKIIRPG
jgi:hypothetical protein